MALLHDEMKWILRRKVLFGIKSITAEGQVDEFTRDDTVLNVWYAALCVHGLKCILSVCVCRRQAGKRRGKNLVEAPEDTVSARHYPEFFALIHWCYLGFPAA